MTEPENLILDHLCAIRGDMSKMADRMETMSAEMTAIRQHLSGVVTLQEHDHTDSRRSNIALKESSVASIWWTSDR